MQSPLPRNATVALLLLLLFFFAVAAISTSAKAKSRKKQGEAAGWNNKHIFPKLHRRERSIHQRTDAAIAKARVFYMQNRGLSEAQKQTKAGLESELTRLVRRRRWTPPSQYSVYNTYPQFSTNPVRYVQRTMQQLSSTVAGLSGRVQNIVSWKSATDLRLERLEASLNAANRRLIEYEHPNGGGPPRSSVIEASDPLEELQEDVEELQRGMEDLRRELGSTASNRRDPVVSGLSSHSAIEIDLSSMSQHDLNGGHPVDVMDEVRSHASRLDAHDRMLRKSSIDITSLQHQLVQVIMKNRRQDASVRFLQAICTNSSSVMQQPSISGDTINHHSTTNFNILSAMNAPGELNKLKETLDDHTQRLDDLQQRDSSSCCQTVDVLTRKTAMLNDLIHEARNRVDESALAVRLNNRKVDELTNKVDMQRLVIKRLQQTVINQQRSVRRLNNDIQENLRTEARQLNASLQRSVTDHVARVADKLSVAQARMQGSIDDNRRSQIATEDVLDQQMRQLFDATLVAQKLEQTLAELTVSSRENDTELFQRVNSNEAMLVGAARLLEEAREEATRHQMASETRITNAERALIGFMEDARQNSVSKDITESYGQMYESVLFLNSSYYQLRSAVHRQSNRYSMLNSFVVRLNQGERKLWERITRMQETFDENHFQSNNASMLLRHMMTSDFSSLRRTVASRFNSLSQNINALATSFEEVTLEQAKLDDTVTTFVMDNDKKLGDMTTKTRHLMEGQAVLDVGQKKIEMQIEEVYSSLNSSVSTMFLNGEEKLLEFEEVLQTQLDIMSTRTFKLEKNSTEHQDRIIHLGRQSHRLRRVAATLRNNLHAVDRQVDVIEADVTDAMDKLKILESGLVAANSSLRKCAKTAEINQMDVKFIKGSINNDRKAFVRFHNLTRAEIANLLEGQQSIRTYNERSWGDIRQTLERDSTQANKFRSKMREERQVQNKRISSLETLNGTLRAEIGLCTDQARHAEGGISELRQADSSIISTLDLHTRALTEHRKLHRNMTTLSDSVFDVIHEQGESLATVREVVVQLNESLAEGKEHIDDAVTSQIERHMREVRSIRYIMHNFTGIIQRVLSDSINQGVKMASVRLRQRSLMESVDNHAASIDRLNHDTARTRATLTAVEVNGDENTRQIGTMALHLRNHERTLDMLDMMTYRLVEAANELNSSLAGQASETDGLRRWIQTDRRLMSDLSDVTATLQEDFSRNKENVWDTIAHLIARQEASEDEGNIRNATLEALEIWSEDAQQRLGSLDRHVDMLDTRFDLIADSMGSIAVLDHNLTSLATVVSDVERTAIETLQTSENLAVLVTGVEELFGIVQGDVSDFRAAYEQQCEHYDSEIAGLSGTVTSHATQIEFFADWLAETLITNREDHSNLTAMLGEIQGDLTSYRDALVHLNGSEANRNDRVEYLINAIAQQNEAVALLNESSDLHSTALKFIHKTNALKTETINGIASTVTDHNRAIEDLQTNQWDTESRISELSARASGVEEQVSLVGARVRSALARKSNSVDADAQRRIRDLESNLNAAKARIALLESDQYFTVNMTNRLLDEAQRQAFQIQVLNSTDRYVELRQVVASLTSTIAAQQLNIFEVNETLTTDLDDLKMLIQDFQLAFDTSGRLMEHYNTEMKIMDLNFTNHIDYFATSIDYLRQIVSETNEAVTENTDRIQSLNESAIFMSFSSFLHDSNLRDGDLASNTSAVPYAQYPGADYEPLNDDAGLLQANYDGEYLYQEDGPEDDGSDPPPLSPVANTRSFDGELRLEDILDGTADDQLIQRRLTSLMDPSDAAGEVDDDNNWDYPNYEYNDDPPDAES